METKLKRPNYSSHVEGVQRGLHTTTYTKIIPVVAPTSAWELLGKLLVVVNYKLLANGENQLNLSKLIGTIVTHYAASLGQETDAEFQNIRYEISKEGLPSFFTAGQLDTIEAASATDIPDAVRIGWSRKSGGARAKAKAALRRTARRPEAPYARSPRPPRELRGGATGAADSSRRGQKSG